MTFRVTLSGRAVARSGLLPQSAHELLEFLSTRADELVALLRACSESEGVDCNDFSFVLIHAAFSSAEYTARVRRRYLPYQLLAQPLTGPQARVRNLLNSGAQYDAMNGAVLAVRWISGVQLRRLESELDIRSGVLTALFADAANIIRGLSDILYAVTATQPTEDLPAGVAASSLASLSQLIAPLRRLAARLDQGLPDDVLWMATIADDSGPLLTRLEILNLRDAGFVAPDDILDPGKFPQLIHAFGPPSPRTNAAAQALQTEVRTWRNAERVRLIESQKRRLPPDCRDLLVRFYRSRERQFEEALEETLVCFGIVIEAKDGPGLTSFPDFITPSLFPTKLAMECKSKVSGDAVTFNDATDVIRKAGVNGYGSAFKLTVCQPYISPDVPRKLVSCNDLCVVNAEDLAEAFVRLKTGKITQQDLADWMTRPGQAVRGSLPTGVPAPVVPPSQMDPA